MKNKSAVLVLLVLAGVFSISGCSGITATTKMADVTPDKTRHLAYLEGVSSKTLVQQVKDSRHYKMFQALVAQAEKETADKTPKFDYTKNCVKCHSPGVIREGDKTAQIPNFFKGGKYADRREGITCADCHELGGRDIFSLRISGWDACAQCHKNSSPEIKLGSRVTDPQIQMIMGTPVGTHEAMPSHKWKHMKDNFSCKDCHVTNRHRHTFFVPGVTATYDDTGLKRTGTSMDWGQFATIFKQEKCIACHANPQSVIGKLKATQMEITSKLDSLQPIYDNWTKKVKMLDKTDPRVIAFNNGVIYFSYVRRDASKGCHNPEYARVLLQNCEKEWALLQ